MLPCMLNCELDTTTQLLSIVLLSDIRRAMINRLLNLLLMSFIDSLMTNPFQLQLYLLANPLLCSGSGCLPQRALGEVDSQTSSLLAVQISECSLG